MMNARTFVTSLVSAGLVAGIAVAAPSAYASSTAEKPAPGAATQDVLSMGELARLRLLTPYESILRKMPKSGITHNYRYSTANNYWSAVIAYSPMTGDADLELYDDKAQTQLLNSSRVGTGLTDFIAIDSNHRALDSYYPRIWKHSGNGSYYVEVAEGAVQLGAGSTDIYMASDDIVAVRDTYLMEGVTYTFTLDPHSAGQDCDMFLMASDSSDSSSWVQRRTDAAAWAATPGSGITETFQYTPTESDWYGLVITNELIGGTFTLTRSS